jgi:hypothetical protein
MSNGSRERAPIPWYLHAIRRMMAITLAKGGFMADDSSDGTVPARRLRLDKHRSLLTDASRPDMPPETEKPPTDTLRILGVEDCEADFKRVVHALKSGLLAVDGDKDDYVEAG